MAPRFGILAGMSDNVTILGAGLAGSEAALQLADRGFRVRLVEMRPGTPTPVHATGACAELVCSNSLKSTKPESAAGMLKAELEALGSHLLAAAHRHAVPAGGALAVDREAFARDVTARIEGHPLVDLVRGEAESLAEAARGADALVVATGPVSYTHLLYATTWPPASWPPAGWTPCSWGPTASPPTATRPTR